MATPRRTQRSPQRSSDRLRDALKERKEALERQAATAEILKVISRSPASTQPVFEAIVAAALKLCSARSANAVTFDGELIHVAAVAEAGASAAAALRRHFGSYPKRPSRDTANTRAILERCGLAGESRSSRGSDRKRLLSTPRRS